MNQRQSRGGDASSLSNSLAEEAFLSHLLTEPEETFNNEAINLQAEDFYDPRNQLIFEVANNLHETYDSINIISVVAELNRLGKLHEAGGLPYLKELVNPAKVTNFGTNPVGLAVLIQEEKTRRDLYEHSLTVTSSVLNGSGLTAEEAVEEAENSILNIVHNTQKSTKTSFSVDNIADSVIDGIRALADSPEGSTPDGVPTGFDKLDEMTTGFKGGQFIIIAARPGVGKALAVDTPILTDSGFVKLKNLEAGKHKVKGRDCSFYNVLAVHESFVSTNSYLLKFEDGAEITADGKHVWVITDTNVKPVHEDTVSMLKTVSQYISEGEQNSVPEIAVALFELFKDHSYTPYLMSVLRRTSETGFLKYFTADLDPEIVAATKTISAEKAQQATMRLALSSDSSGEDPVVLKINRLRSLYLHAVSSANGENGTIASPVFNTLDVFRKLINEMEGSTAPQTYEQTTEELFAQVNTPGGGSERFIPHPGEETGSNRIVSIEKLTEPVEVRCITVASPDGTFLAGDKETVTHNSTIAVDFARNASFLAGKTTLFFSLEMSEKELTTRILSAESRVESSKLKHGNLSDVDWMQIAEAREKLRRGTFIIDVNTEASLSYIRSVANKQRMKPEGLDMIIIDYLQLLQMRNPEGRQQAVSDTSRGLKLLAKDLDVPIVVLSQLNRKVEERTNGRPMISDLRESGSLEQDADMVLMLHRPEVNTPDERPGQTDLIVAKHRGGETGIVPLTSMLQYSKFVPGTGLIEISDEEEQSLGIDDEDSAQPW